MFLKLYSHSFTIDKVVVLVVHEISAFIYVVGSIVDEELSGSGLDLYFERLFVLKQEWRHWGFEGTWFYGILIEIFVLLWRGMSSDNF